MIRNRFFLILPLIVLALAGCGPEKPARPPCPDGEVCLHLGNGSPSP